MVSALESRWSVRIIVLVNHDKNQWSVGMRICINGSFETQELLFREKILKKYLNELACLRLRKFLLGGSLFLSSIFVWIR
jgi:hypothetical protein